MLPPPDLRLRTWSHPGQIHCTLQQTVIRTVWCALMVVASFTLSVTFPTAAVSQTPSIVSIGHAINDTPNTRQIIRTSSGRIYYFTGDQAYAGPSSGAVEVHTSLGGRSWTQVSTREQYRIDSSIGVAVDSQDMVHMITYDWNGRPYYQRFHTADSARGDHGWDSYELIETAPFSDNGNCVIAVDADDVPHVVYRLYERYKGKDYYTLHYANRIGGM